MIMMIIRSMFISLLSILFDEKFSYIYVDIYKSIYACRFEVAPALKVIALVYIYSMNFIYRCKYIYIYTYIP